MMNDQMMKISFLTTAQRLRTRSMCILPSSIQKVALYVAQTYIAVQLEFSFNTMLSVQKHKQTKQSNNTAASRGKRYELCLSQVNFEPQTFFA